MLRWYVTLAFIFLASLLLSANAADQGRAGAGPGGPAGPGGGASGSANYGKDQNGSGQYATGEYFHTLGWIKDYAGDLAKKRGVEIPEAKEPLAQLQADTDFLQRRWMAWPREHPREKPYPVTPQLDPYYRALMGSYKQLKLAKSANKEEALEIIRSVATDLHAKAENCRHSVDGLGKSISVTVHTRRGADELGGFQVWCVPVALVRFTNEHICFPKISSPTVYKNFPPGFYTMWLTKDGRKFPSESHLVGGKGETEFLLDLAVASDATDRR